ncbi:hypothetical protein [Nodularia sp. UHCC 0506]|uniref:hypothetical protein n=1 Tax=Nodularia sp. UHCC 0506 TaxID=3110243 RepID=UPI002B209953|nr:hypothetical protein [Nodularia sp. UHCC 0506]MEA5515092.1 hypothetical protein [Nodularia sp. UHCC 0506]
MKRSHIIDIAIIALLSLSSLGIVGGSVFLQNSVNNSSKVKIITDTSRYQEILQHFGSNHEYITHFPHALYGAKNVRIAYYSGLPTEEKFFQIRLKHSPEKIQKLLAQYKKIAKYQYTGGNTNDHVNLHNGVPTTFFYTSDASKESFPATYEILVLDAKDTGTPGFKWNHGHSYGVAIDSSASEIVYWTEKW